MNKRFKLGLLTLLVICFSFISSLAVLGYDNLKSSKAPAVTVTQKNIKKNTEAIDMNLKIPVVHKVKKTAAQVKINNLFYNDAVNFAKPLEKDAKKYLADTKKNKDLHFNKYSAYTDFKTKFNRNNLLSIPVRYYQYTGGANGLEVQRGYTFDLNTGKLLSLSDLFDKGFDFRQVLSDEILKQIKAHPDQYFPDAAAKFKKIPYNQSFYIDNGNIVIFYGPFEIAPHAAGIPEFKIPFSKLKFNKNIEKELSI